MIKNNITFPSNFPLFQKQLLSWYRKNARDLPWRRTGDPYKIWISEIMLQQTQVQTVIPYYERWLKRFPDIRTLAKAPESEVMKYWAGLGYYRRARMIHAAAKWLVEKKAGKFPRTAKELLELPGIGRYTAGAIASIAFGEKTPVLDGNVIRVLTRLVTIKDDIGKPGTIEKLWVLAEGLLADLKSSLSLRAKRSNLRDCHARLRRARNDIGDFNQAMMELGATTCTPQNPSCLLCPVTGLCEGRKGNPEDFPVRKMKEKIEKIKTAALILRNNGKVFVGRQTAKERWGGLWVFPFGKDLRSILEKFRIPEIDLKHKLTIRHGFTKYQVSLDVYEYTFLSLRGAPTLKGGYAEGRRSNLKDCKIAALPPVARNDKKAVTQWVSIKNLSSLAFPSPHQKIVQVLLEASSRKRESASGSPTKTFGDDMNEL